MNVRGIMVQGCSSDAGKSYVATALCRILANSGYRVTPFKSQNMSNNSYVTWDGKEIGRAQGVQAEAARVRAETYMNPILLKPRKDTGAEIVLFGEVHKTAQAQDYQRDFTMGTGLQAVRKALSSIEKHFDCVVIEGAGSPAEVNLNEREIVNMRIAAEADVPVLLVVDVNRGGSFAAIVGTLELVGRDRERIKGIIFNQFRGDISLFEDGVKWLESYTGIKVAGVLPYLPDVLIEGEDSLSINFVHQSGQAKSIKIGVLRLPYLSNHTDLEIFRYEEDVDIAMIDQHTSWQGLDALIIPGTKSSIGDIQYLERQGMAEKIRNFHGHIFGICGGYQMLGERLIDEDGVDFQAGYVQEGLKLLPVETHFRAGKEVGQVRAQAVHPLLADMAVDGYEIHLGVTDGCGPDYAPLWRIGERLDGAAREDFRVAGSYLHNIFHNDVFRNFWLNRLRAAKGLPERPPLDTRALKDIQYEKLASHAEQYLDIPFIVDLIEGRY